MQEDTDITYDGEGWQRRWTIVAFCFTAFLLCNLDRVNLSISIIPMAQEYGWDEVCSPITCLLRT